MSKKNINGNISLFVVSNNEHLLVKMFPDGCDGCPGLCCITICGQPPDVMPKGGPTKTCIELTESGFCGIHLRDGYDKKPDLCKRLQVGSPECLAARREGGL